MIGCDRIGRLRYHMVEFSIYVTSVISKPTPVPGPPWRRPRVNQARSAHRHVAAGYRYAEIMKILSAEHLAQWKGVFSS